MERIALRNLASADLPPEATRNQVLRRADGRFLLPQVRPAQSICFADGLLAQAVAAISDQVVEAGKSAAGQCDLAVAVDADRATLQAAWSALHPGGWCYSEWHSPLAGSAPRIRQRLQAAGFAEVECYWPWPRPGPGRALPQFWLPLDAPGLVDYFLRQRSLIDGFKRRAAFAARRASWYVIDRFGMQRPVCAVARKPRAARRPGEPLAAEGDWLEYLRAHWAEWGLGGTPDRLCRLLLTGGQHSLNKVVALVAAAPDCAPQVAVKLARVPEAYNSLRREAATLQTVYERRPQLSGIPRVLFCLEQDSSPIVGETVLGGMPLYTRLRRENFRSLALAAADWLVELAGQTASAPRASWWPRLVEATVAEFQENFGVIVDQQKLDQARASLAQLTDLPLVCEQRDFSPWNVLIDADDNWIVLDWESAELDGLPARDLIYFLTYLAFFRAGAMESGHYREAYRDLLNPQSETGAVFTECLTRYTAQVGIDPAALKPLRLLTWMSHARSEYGRFAAEVGGRAATALHSIHAQPAPAALRQSLFVSLWEEELAQSA
jgi:hypothetical protein